MSRVLVALLTLAGTALAAWCSLHLLGRSIAKAITERVRLDADDVPGGV